MAGTVRFPPRSPFRPDHLVAPRPPLRPHPPPSSRWTTPAPSTSAGGCESRTGSWPRSARASPARRRARDLGGAVVTPGFVNTHHHLYQTLTRARAQDADLFTWLRTLYPVWARIDAEMEYAAARTGLAELALSGCSTVFDHHYVFPRGESGIVEAEVQAARELGVRIVASRGSMDLGVSDGGLPPDELVEELDAVLADTERLAATRRRRPGPDRGRALLAVLGHDEADGGVGRARPPARARPPHAPRRDGRGGGLLPRALRLHAGRVPRAGRLARRRRVVRALHPPLATRGRAVRRARRGRRPLPDVESAPRRGRRAGPASSSTRACGSASASTAPRRTSGATSSSRSSRRSSSRAAAAAAAR